MMESTGLICGIDEAGRGPLAGPVCAAAVILGELINRDALKDSKQLSAGSRERIAAHIISEAAAVGIGWAWPEEIDRINIHHASLLAMQRAFEALPSEAPIVSMVLVDGKFIPVLPR